MKRTTKQQLDIRYAVLIDKIMDEKVPWFHHLPFFCAFAGIPNEIEFKQRNMQMLQQAMILEYLGLILESLPARGKTNPSKKKNHE